MAGGHGLITNNEAFLQRGKRELYKKYYQKPSTKTSMTDFVTLRTLGSGTFGTVILVKRKRTGHYYAIKVMIKEKVIRQHAVEHTLKEKRTLQSMNHPFLVRMDFCFKDNSNVYFVMPFVNGGDMYHHLRRKKKFNEVLARFYAAQLVLGIEYLQFSDIVHRDIKPENIMIDSTGYLKITDMGFAKIVPARTWTFCGTPPFMAPEIILHKGYGKVVDWWSFGVVLYEMASGHLPFHSTERMALFEKIVSGKYYMVHDFSFDLKDLIYNILQVDLTKRYGNLKNGVNDIKKHKWFRPTSWLALLNRKVKPPFVPSVHGAGDAANFDKREKLDLKISPVNLYPNEFKDF